MSWYRFASLLAFALVLVSVVEAQQEITSLIVKAPANEDVQIQLVSTDKDSISAEVNGRTVPVVIDDSTATALIDVDANDNNGNNNKGGNKGKGKGKSHHKSVASKSPENNKGGSDDDSAAFTLKSSSTSSLVLFFVVAFSLVAFVGVSQQQQRGPTTTLLFTLATILCVTVALISNTSEAQVNETVTATGFVPDFLILISHEYFVIYTIPKGGEITFYFYRASRALALVGATSAERLSNVATGLTSAGFLVTTLDATTSTPTVAFLKSFEFVLVFSDPAHSFFDKVALGDTLARAYDSGAKIITATFANAAEQPLGGRFADVSEGYILLNPSAAATTSASASLGTVLGLTCSIHFVLFA